MPGSRVRLRVATVLITVAAPSACAPAFAGHGDSSAVCRPPDSIAAVDPARLDPASMVGDYTLLVITQWTLRTDTIARGRMELMLDTMPPLPPMPPLQTVEPSQPTGPGMVPRDPMRTRQRINGTSYPRPSLIGATNAPLESVYVASSVPPDSREPRAPGLRLVGSALSAGAVPEGWFREDGFATALVITELRPDGFAGTWRWRPDMFQPIGVEVAGWPFGYFCAVRRSSS